MKVAFLHCLSNSPVVPSFFSRSPVLSRRPGLGLGFRETAMAALSGSREPDLLLNQKDKKEEAADEVEEQKKKDEIDEDLLKKELGDPPEKPLSGDCCGSGCVRCVWDIYFEELELYNSRKAALEARQ